MFGNPEWFRMKTVSWGLHPVTWRGWLYASMWTGAICIPFVALLVNAKVLESLIWVVVMMAALLWDVKQVMRQMAAGSDLEEDVLIIDENTSPDPSSFTTHSYDLHCRC